MDRKNIIKNIERKQEKFLFSFVISSSDPVANFSWEFSVRSTRCNPPALP